MNIVGNLDYLTPDQTQVESVDWWCWTEFGGARNGAY